MLAIWHDYLKYGNFMVEYFLAKERNDNTVKNEEAVF